MPGRPKLTWGRAWNKLNAVTAYQTLMFLFVIFGWYVPHWAFHIFVHAYKWDFLICPVHKKCLLPQKQTQKERNLFDRNWTFFGSLSLSRFPDLQINMHALFLLIQDCTMDLWEALPVYSDRIVQDFHLIPFSRRNHRYRLALNTLYGIVPVYYSIPAGRRQYPEGLNPSLIWNCF